MKTAAEAARMAISKAGMARTCQSRDFAATQKESKQTVTKSEHPRELVDDMAHPPGLGFANGILSEDFLQTAALACQPLWTERAGRQPTYPSRREQAPS